MRRSSVAQMLLRLAGHGLTLYGWQRRFIDDSSRFRILLKPRGAGATFTIALEALTNALLKPKTTTILLSYSLRQSLEIFRHVKELLEKISSNTVKLNGLPYRLQHTTGQRSTMLGNGSRIISLPNNPETLRGYRADNLYVDEAALFRDDFRIRTAVMFTTVARQGRVVLASTPKGKRGWFYTAWAGEQGWSKHLVTLGECPHISKEDVEGLRRVMSDLEWRQEMECEFLDEANAFIPYEKILECVQDYVPAKPDPGEQAFIGVDFGRYRDSTVIVGVARNPETGLRICYLEELRRKSFDEQLSAILRAVEALHPARVAVDSTGDGRPTSRNTLKTGTGPHTCHDNRQPQNNTYHKPPKHNSPTPDNHPRRRHIPDKPAEAFPAGRGRRPHQIRRTTRRTRRPRHSPRAGMLRSPDNHHIKSRGRKFLAMANYLRSSRLRAAR
jgi:phage FluMu gp28-like protein